MDKTFNELFDDFFKRNNINKDDTPNKNLEENIKKILDMLSLTNNVDNIDEESEKALDETLGKPDKIEFYNEGNIFFEKRTWKTPNGDLVKTLITDEPTLKISLDPQKPLQEQLDEAVKKEEYEKAAAIRDEMNKRLKRKKSNS